MRWGIGGVVAGLAPHVLAIGVFFVQWHFDRAASAPQCFPDENGVAGILLASLAADFAVSLVCVAFVRLVKRPQFTWDS
jgi:hypothetical protein